VTEPSTMREAETTTRQRIAEHLAERSGDVFDVL
jgi:hypothetical protein